MAGMAAESSKESLTGPVNLEQGSGSSFFSDCWRNSPGHCPRPDDQPSDLSFSAGPAWSSFALSGGSSSSTCQGPQRHVPGMLLLHRRSSLCGPSLTPFAVGLEIWNVSDREWGVLMAIVKYHRQKTRPIGIASWFSFWFLKANYLGR